MELPSVLDEARRGDNSLYFELSIDPGHPYFQGHFDGAPVLAGFVQVGWVLALAQSRLGMTWDFLGLPSVKFQRLVLPPARLTLTVDYLPQRGMLKFKYSDAGGGYSVGGIAVRERREGGNDD